MKPLLSLLLASLLLAPAAFTADAKAYLLVARDRTAAVAPGEVVVVDTANGSVLRHWSARLGAAPTPTELSDAAARIAAAETLRAALRAAFGQLPPGVQVAFEPAFRRIRSLLDRCNITAARAVLETIPVPDELETQRAALLALFPAP